MQTFIRSFIFISIIAIITSPAFAFAGDFAHVTYSGSADPGGSVRAKVTSSYMDPGEANVVWYADGVYLGKGPATQDMQINLGALGTATKVTALITYRGAQYKEEISVLPAVVDVLWEARTATPPFYRGKAIPSHNSVVRLMAIPRFSANGKDEPSYAQYLWTMDNKAQVGRGVSRDSVQVLGGWPDSSTSIGVKVAAGDNAIGHSVAVPSHAPVPLFYETSPTEGVLTEHSFVSTVERPDQHLSLLLVPFGISLADVKKDRILYSWSLGGKEVYSGNGQDYASLDLTRSKKPDETGTVEVSAKIQSLANVMEFGSSLFKWNYTK